MSDLGYLMEYQLLDAQSFLLRQRRNRVWATLDVAGGQDCDVFRAGVKRSVEAMASKRLFPAEKCFREDLPQTKKFNATELHNVNHAHDLAQKTKGDPDVFADVSKSVGRREVAYGVTTCIRPTHPIYSVKRKRLLTVAELWEQQGLWADDFPNPQAVKQFIDEKPRAAQDLAGLLDVKCANYG